MGRGAIIATKELLINGSKNGVVILTLNRPEKMNVLAGRLLRLRMICL